MAADRRTAVCSRMTPSCVAGRPKQKPLDAAGYSSHVSIDAAIPNPPPSLTRSAMPAFICNTCGTQYAPSEKPPAECAICSEERQYVLPEGQTWTTLEALARKHFNAYRQYEPALIGIGSQPHFGIGQRALLVRTPQGNVLWDCISLLDAAT